MSHTDPRLAIPVGMFLALVGVYLAVKPEKFYSNDFVKYGWSSLFERLFGRHGALWALRVFMLILVMWSGWLVVHESLILIGR